MADHPVRRGMVRYHVQAGDEFKQVLKALRVQDKTLPGKFKRRLREVSKNSTKKVQAAVLDLPKRGRQHSGLYRRVGRGVRLKVNRSGDSVRIITTMTDPREAVIPRGLDTPHGWYHPVFGRGDTRDEMVRQPGYSWFRETIAEERGNYERAFEGVLQEARDMIADAGE